MSETHHPDFTAFGAIGETIRVMRSEFRFFTTLIVIYVAVSVTPYLFMLDGVDFTDPEVLLGQMQNGQPYIFALYIVYYLLYAVFIIYVLDRTNASLNNYPMSEYPYINRATMCAVPVILIYIISAFLAGIGFILLIVPGLIIMAGLFLAIPAKLAENINFLSAISRSWELTKGHRLSIWGVILIPLIPLILISFVGMSVIMDDVRETGEISSMFSPAWLAISAVVNIAFATFFFAASGVVYHQLINENLQDGSTFD